MSREDAIVAPPPQPKPKVNHAGEDEVTVLENRALEGRQRDMEAVRGKACADRDITGVLSPRRVIDVSKKMGMRVGYSLDLTAPGPGGKVWDFGRAGDRLKLWRLTKRDRSYVIIGSPPCTVWSLLQNLSRGKPGGEERLREMRRAPEEHLKFSCELYCHQHQKR